MLTDAYYFNRLQDSFRIALYASNLYQFKDEIKLFTLDWMCIRNTPYSDYLIILLLKKTDRCINYALKILHFF